MARKEFERGDGPHPKRSVEKKIIPEGFSFTSEEKALLGLPENFGSADYLPLSAFLKRTEVTLPELPKGSIEAPGIFVRGEVPTQKPFDETVKDIVIPPIRAELINGNLATHLRQLQEQRGREERPLGVILLINDNAGDSQEVVEQNKQTAEYLNALTTKNPDALEQLPISDEYKQLGQEIIAGDKVHIRYDQLHFSGEEPSFGGLRMHLLRLTKAFKNDNVLDKDIIVHFSDVDTTYSANHFQTLQEFYTDRTHETNFTEQEFLPGIHENPEGEDLTRDMLLHLDEFRLYKYGTDIYALVQGEAQTGSPVISGRLSNFFIGAQLHPQLVDIGDKQAVGEDYEIGTFLRKRSFTGKIGHAGEIHRQHRARNPQQRTESRTDGEEAFNFIMDKKEGRNPYQFSDSFVWRTEGMVGLCSNKSNPQDSHSGNFTESDEYNALLQTEMKKERAKVRLRSIRLATYIDSLATDTPVTENEKKIFEPYRHHFADEIEDIKQHLAAGVSSQEIADSYRRTYTSFLNPDASIHTEIAKIRALKKYVLAHNLTY